MRKLLAIFLLWGGVCCAQIPLILTIQSDPDPGVTITVSPPDFFGNSDGDTPFMQLDGVDNTTDPVMIINVSLAHTAEAFYIVEDVCDCKTITIMSVNPASGVTIQATADTLGLGAGVTTFTRV